MNGLHRGTAPALVYLAIFILVPAGCVKHQVQVSQTGQASEIEFVPERETLSEYIRSLHSISKVVDQQDVVAEELHSSLSVEAARQLWQSGKVTGAVNVLLKVIDQDGENVEAYILLADILDRSGSYHQALGYANRAVQLASSSSSALEVLARAQLHVGMSAAAVASYEKLIELGKDEMEALPKIALAHMQAGEWEQARTALEKVTASPGAPREAINNLAIVLGNLGHFEESLTYFKKANRPAAAFNNLGVVFSEQQKWEEAHQAFSRALELEPNYAKALVNRQEVESYLPMPMVVSLNDIPVQTLPVITLLPAPGTRIQEIDLAEATFESTGVLDLDQQGLNNTVKEPNSNSRSEAANTGSEVVTAIVTLPPVNGRPALSSTPLEAIEFSNKIFTENAFRLPAPELPDLSTLELPLVVDVPAAKGQEEVTEAQRGLPERVAAPSPESSHLLITPMRLRSLEELLSVHLPGRVQASVVPVDAAASSQQKGRLGRTWESLSVAVSDFLSKVFGG